MVIMTDNNNRAMDVILVWNANFKEIENGKDHIGNFDEMREEEPKIRNQ
jgi:hypothetical protein